MYEIDAQHIEKDDQGMVVISPPPVKQEMEEFATQAVQAIAFCQMEIERLTAEKTRLQDLIDMHTRTAEQTVLAMEKTGADLFLQAKIDAVTEQRRLVRIAAQEQ